MDQLRSRAPHVGRGAPEFEQRAISHACQAPGAGRRRDRLAAQYGTNRRSPKAWGAGRLAGLLPTTRYVRRPYGAYSNAAPELELVQLSGQGHRVFWRAGRQPISRSGDYEFFVRLQLLGLLRNFAVAALSRLGYLA